MASGVILLCAGVLFIGAWPLWQAWQANRTTTLSQTVLWLTATWLTWLTLLGNAAINPSPSPLLGYLALCLTACTGVAVLGARRPGVGAWNFVVVGLLVVLLLPVAQGWGEPRLHTAHFLFLGAALALVLLNHLPTRFGLAVLCYTPACVIEFLRLLLIPVGDAWLLAGYLLLALTPWLALAGVVGSRSRNEVDTVWLAFRDRYGFLWGQRLREQFNRAAVYAGWPLVLRWHGLEGPGVSDPAVLPEALDTLKATLKRFGTE